MVMLEVTSEVKSQVREPGRGRGHRGARSEVRCEIMVTTKVICFDMGQYTGHNRRKKQEVRLDFEGQAKQHLKRNTRPTN